MKSISIQYFEAMKRLKAKGVTLLRDVYMTLMPGKYLQYIHLRFIPEGVAEASQILLRDAHVLPK
jgi:hypothetical protein